MPSSGIWKTVVVTGLVVLVDVLLGVVEVEVAALLVEVVDIVAAAFL
jgi:hypothetical protein